MDEKINKSSLKEAKATYEEIQKFAIKEATKNLQEDVSKKVVEIMNNSIEENTSEEGKEIVQEEVTIVTDEATVVVDDSGNVEIDAEGSLEMGDEEIGEPIDMDAEEIVVDDSEDEIEIDNSEIEEMNIEETNFEEQDAMAAAAPAVAPEAAPVEMPAELPAEEMPVEEMPAEDAMANPFEILNDKMDQIMAQLGGSAGGEEIDIIDDTAGMEAPMEAPIEAPVAEEITFEVVNDMQVPEMEDEVLEIVGEDEETVDEVKMMGVSNTVQRSTGDSAGPAKSKEERARYAMKENKENKAQHEAKIAELIKENDSLKTEKDEVEQELIKFENGFIKLQENFEKMQDYNAKLVMAYRVAMSGGLTTDEKIQISEQFDKCETVKDAETLYKSIVNEHKIKVNKNPEKSIKSNAIKTVAAKSVSQPLYESKEISRMKQLAGIKNLNE